MAEERFWAKVNKEGPDGCWEWLAYKRKIGYGIYWYNGEKISAHRYSWILHNGLIPEGLVVRHKCKGAALYGCCNPDHLELGTRAENNADMIRDETSLKGIKNPNNKLTPEQVKEIRAQVNEVQGKDLAKKYNVSIATISSIINNKRWAWLT